MNTISSSLDLWESHKKFLKISVYVRVHIKHYPEKFAFLILRILELFTCEVCIFLQK